MHTGGQGITAFWKYAIMQNSSRPRTPSGPQSQQAAELQRARNQEPQRTFSEREFEASLPFWKSERHQRFRSGTRVSSWNRPALLLYL
jgi:hypothetical protein